MLSSIYIASQGLINNTPSTSLGIASQGLLRSGVIPPEPRGFAGGKYRTDYQEQKEKKKFDFKRDDEEVLFLIKSFIQTR